MRHENKVHGREEGHEAEKRVLEVDMIEMDLIADAWYWVCYFAATVT